MISVDDGFLVSINVFLFFSFYLNGFLVGCILLGLKGYFC